MDTIEKVKAIIANGSFNTELKALRKIILSTGLTETIKWGNPVYTYQNGNVVGITAFKAHFGVWFFQGALLKDKHKKLMNAQEGRTKAMRQWRMTSKADIDESILHLYLKEAIENEKNGRRIEADKPIRKTPALPPELKTALTKSAKLKTAFESLTPGRQKEYAEYITSAKRAETKLSRIQKITPIILSGAGLNDKYIKS